MIQLAPIVLSSIALMASGKANPLYAPDPILRVSCALPVEYAGGEAIVFYGDPYEMFFDRATCKNLNRFARTPRLRGDDFSDSAVGMAWSLRVATHEASHVYLWRSPGGEPTEKQVDCLAVRNVARFARKLGASKKTAQRVYRLNAAMALDEDYASACGQGHPFKIRTLPN